jgi:hypothetical protein
VQEEVDAAIEALKNLKLDMEKKQKVGKQPSSGVLQCRQQAPQAIECRAVLPWFSASPSAGVRAGL